MGKHNLEIPEPPGLPTLDQPLTDNTTKRGKDIKVFADLPPAVQNTINMMSRCDGKIDPIDKARRTKIAIHYQTTCFGYQGM